MKILHVFGRLSRTGGAEKWVLDLLHHGDSRVRFDFLLSVNDVSLVEEVKRLGSTVHQVPFSRSPMPWSVANPYLSGVRTVLRAERYDVVHVHQFDLAGEILRIAAQENVPGRVMSVHATEYENPRFYRRLVHRVWGRPWIFRYATSILPCSRAVGESFLPRGRGLESKTEILYTGIEPSVFREAIARKSGSTIRDQCGIPGSATVIGHIGRFTRQKNHEFLIDLLECLIRQDDNIRAVLLGRGELLEPMRERVRTKGLAQRISLPGPRDDVPDCFAAMFDVLVLPSLYEGLPIVAIEALACGLGVVMSDRISDELDVFFPGRVIRLPLEESPDRWGEAIRNMIAARRDPTEALAELEQTPLTIRASLESLVSIYQKTTSRGRQVPG